MKYFKYILSSLLLVLALSSCEKEINLNLKEAEPRLVIDAKVRHREPCMVRLSLTQSYWDNTPAPTVSGAIITIRNESGASQTLTEMNNEGLYFSAMIGTANETYTLDVEVDNVVYSATATIPPVIAIDSIYLYNINLGNEYMNLPCIVFQDTKDVKNFYGFHVTINDRLMNSFSFDNDKYFDGLKKQNILYFDKEENFDEKLKLGDRVMIEMQSLDEGAYDYYASLRSPGGSPNSNPTSNFSNNALGMFKAYSTSFIEMKIEEGDIKE